jgi:predicted DNA-binding transcriptional regulator AlpA
MLLVNNTWGGASMDTPRWIDEKRAAQIMGLARQTLANARFRGAGCPYSKIGRAVRYSERDVIAFMESRKISTKSE